MLLCNHRMLRLNSTSCSQLFVVITHIWKWSSGAGTVNRVKSVFLFRRMADIDSENKQTASGHGQRLEDSIKVECGVLNTWWTPQFNHRRILDWVPTQGCLLSSSSSSCLPLPEYTEWVVHTPPPPPPLPVSATVLHDSRCFFTKEHPLEIANNPKPSQLACGDLHQRAL